MKTKIIYSLIASCLFGFIGNPLAAQNTCLKDKWDFKLDYSQGPFTNMYGKKSGNIYLEADYGLSNLIETGAYLGMTKYIRHEYTFSDTLNHPHFNLESATTPLIGISLNFHPLPLVIHKEGLRFDLYLAGKLGGFYFSGNENDIPHGYELQLFMGGGMEFCILRNAGLFIEYGKERSTVGRYHWNDKLIVGITVKLK